MSGSKTTVDGGETRRIEVFRPGTFRALNGHVVTYTPEDVAALAASYDPSAAPAPVVVGHPKTDSPAFGWVKRLHFDAAAERLFADIGDIAPEFERAVREGRYKKISISIFPPQAAANPRPGKPYLKHVGFLGGAAPAVPGLKPVTLAGDDDAVTIELADPDVGLVADALRKLREWIIDKFGSTEAEKALPGHFIDWIDNSQRQAQAVFLDAAAPDDADTQDVWGNDVILAYVPATARTPMEPSYAYTYQLKGTPAVEKGYYDDDRRSWELPVISEQAPVITGADAGFLIKTAA